MLYLDLAPKPSWPLYKYTDPFLTLSWFKQYCSFSK